LDPFEKPGSGANPVPVDAALADADGLGGFFVGPATKEFEHHDSRAFGIHPLEFFQCLIDQQHVFILAGCGEIEIINIEALLTTAVLQAGFAPRVIDQNPSHRFRCGVEKIGLIFPIPFPAASN